MSSCNEVRPRIFEQRKNRRFPLSLPVEYEVFDGVGKGTSTDISSGGLMFKTDKALPTLGRMRLSVAWPCPLDGGIPLQLVIEGKVLRSDSGCAAVQILRYEFKTKGSADRIEFDPTRLPRLVYA